MRMARRLERPTSASMAGPKLSASPLMRSREQMTNSFSGSMGGCCPLAMPAPPPLACSCIVSIRMHLSKVAWAYGSYAGPARCSAVTA